jgi:hypothetical protein
VIIGSDVKHYLNKKSRYLSEFYEAVAIYKVNRTLQHRQLFEFSRRS